MLLTRSNSDFLAGTSLYVIRSAGASLRSASSYSQLTTIQEAHSVRESPENGEDLLVCGKWGIAQTKINFRRRRNRTPSPLSKTTELPGKGHARNQMETRKQVERGR